MPNLSIEAVREKLAYLSDPDINFRIDLASTPHVARKIIQSLPGVKELAENGPEVEEMVLGLLADDSTLQNENLTSIGLHILQSYPTARVKAALAKPISERKFRGFSGQFAAEAFLKAAQIEHLKKDAIAVALTEARKLHPIATETVQPTKSRKPRPAIARTVTMEKREQKSGPRRKSVKDRRKRSLALKK